MEIKACCHQVTSSFHSFDVRSNLDRKHEYPASMTDITKETNHALAPVPGDSKSSGNELLLRFFQSDWFTPAVSPVLFVLTIAMRHVSGAVH